MRVIGLIGFPDHIAAELTAQLARQGYRVSQHRRADELQVQPAAVFVCGDSTGWLETICEVRAMYSRVFLVAVTRASDHEKWLDALDAGANDYCAMPLDDRQFEWLLRRETPRHRAETATARAASL